MTVHLEIKILNFFINDQEAYKCTAQILNNDNRRTPTKTVKPKITKPNTLVTYISAKEEEKNREMNEILQMFETVTKKLEKLDNIETDMKEIKKSLEFAHAEINDLKKENKLMMINQTKAEEIIEILEQDKNTLPESKDENTTEMIHKLLESKLEIEDAQNKVKID